jgi:hypothetical protein
VLVNRAWPGGLTRARACVDEWLREFGPSTALRRWFANNPRRWDELRSRYRTELSRPGVFWAMTVNSPIAGAPAARRRRDRPGGALVSWAFHLVAPRLAREVIHMNDWTDGQVGYAVLGIIGGLFLSLMVMLGLVIAYAAL